jgi:O-antigen ligase
VRWLLFVYFLLSGVTWVAGQAGRGVSGRIALPDVYLPVLVLAMVATQKTSLRVPSLAVASFFMLLTFAPGVILSSAVSSSLLELAIYGYAALGFFIIYNLVVRLPIDQRVELMVWWSRAGALLALIGIYDLFAVTTGLPRIAIMLGQTVRSQGGLTGTFRNTGQAGSFMGTVLAVALPLSVVIQDRKRKNELTIITAIVILALVLTVKRAALIGLIVGGTLFLMRGLQRRQLGRTLAVLAVSALVLIPSYRWMSSASEAFRWRTTAKLTSRATESVSRFAVSNLDATREAFAAEPLVGVGVGTIGASGEDFEIHSTYLNVLASAGLLGVVGYVVLVWVLYRSVTRPRNDDPRTARFARLFVPMMVGLMLSYGYTNHLRKREFWITAALVTAFMAPEAVRRGRRPPVAWRRPPGAVPLRPAELAGAPPGG